MIERMRGTKAGFTLVELIVVIAILGILAGISVPVYSGYIAKAGEAADLQLLGAVNTAYSAACAELGIDPTKVSANASLTGETGAKKIGTVSARLGTAAIEGFNETFERYFAGNEDSTFKRFNSVIYNRANGVFKGTDWELNYNAETGVYSVTNSRGETVTVTEANRNALLASTFGTAMDIGELMDDVDFVAAAAGQVFTQYATGGAAQVASFMDGAQTGKFHDLLTTLGLGDDATSQELANAVVLDVASRTQSLTTEQLLEFVQSGGTNTSIFGAGGGGTAAAAALSYALATAYVNSEEGQNATIQYFDYADLFAGGTGFINMSASDYYNSVNNQLMSGEIDGGEALSLVQTMWMRMYQDVGGTPNTNASSYLTNHGNADVSGYLGSMQTIAQNINNIDGATYASEGMNGNYMSEILSLLYG